MDKKILQRILTVTFVSALTLPTIAWGAILGYCKISGTPTDNFIFDTGENRNKNKFPTSFNVDDYTSKINDWFDDNMPFRDTLYTAYKTMNNALESRYLLHLKPFLDSIVSLLTSSDLLEQYNNGYSDGYSAGLGEGGFGQDELEKAESEGYSRGYAEGYSEGIGDIENCSHQFEKTWIESLPSCQEEGLMLGECSKCGKTISIAISKKPHENVLFKNVEPTCLKDGAEIYRCQVCGNEATTILPGGHSGKFIRKVAASYEDYGYDLYQCSNCGSYYRENIVEKPIDSSFKSPTKVGYGTVLGRNNWLFYSGDSSLSIYTGDLYYGNEVFDEWANIMGRLIKYCNQNNKKIVFEIYPNREKLYSEYMPTYSRNGNDNMKRAANYIKEKYGYDFHYQLDELSAYKPYYQVAYKYDTHWNKAGAFVGTQNIYKHFGLESTDIRRVKIAEQNINSGGLVGMGGLNAADYVNDKEYVISYSGYSDIYDDSIKSKSMTYIGDSFRDNSLPIFQKDFSNVWTYHYDGDSFNDMASSIKESDYIVISAVERYAYTLFYDVQYILPHLGI